MKIQVDGKALFELSKTQEKVIKNEILEDIFEEDMKRRLQYILTHKYEQCFERLKKHWIPILKERIDSFPSNDEELANLIFSQKDYKNRSAREGGK